MTKGRKRWQGITPKYLGLDLYTTFVLHLFFFLSFMNGLVTQEGDGMKKWNLAGKKVPTVLVLLLENKFSYHWRGALT